MKNRGDKRKMTDEELKKKCTERAKIFQQAMESCHSSSPIDCIEWFADLEKENAELKEQIEKVKYALRKIIKTVQNDIIDSYRERLVKIYDISCEVLQELEKMNKQYETEPRQIQPIPNQRSIQNKKLSKAKELLQKCLNTYLRDPELRNEVERFLKEEI